MRVRCGATKVDGEDGAAALVSAVESWSEVAPSPTSGVCYSGRVLRIGPARAGSVARRRETPACVGSERCCRSDPVPGSCHSIRCRNRSSWSVQAPPCGPRAGERGPRSARTAGTSPAQATPALPPTKTTAQTAAARNLCESLPQPFGATPCCPAGMLRQWIVRRDAATGTRTVSVEGRRSHNGSPSPLHHPRWVSRSLFVICR